MEAEWEGWQGGDGAPDDVSEPSHHMTAPADEAVPPAPLPDGAARPPLPPAGTAALGSCGDEVSGQGAVPAGPGTGPSGRGGCGAVSPVRGCPAQAEAAGGPRQCGASCGAGPAPHGPAGRDRQQIPGQRLTQRAWTLIPVPGERLAPLGANNAFFSYLCFIV